MRQEEDQYIFITGMKLIYISVSLVIRLPICMVEEYLAMV